MTRTFASSILAVVLALGSAVHAQTPTHVSGTLSDAQSGLPIPDAVVSIESPTSTVQARTDAEGRFSADVPPGAYHLNVRAQGYRGSRSELEVGTAEATADLRLNPDVHFTETVSVSPGSRSQFDAYQPTTVLGGQELTKQLQGTLGATVENQPGMSLRSFGPGPARPVIRGLDGDRVLVLEDGQRMGDLSSQSGDHGTNVNPASASRIEVVRGPATLLYGANAIGGLVNVVTTEIPDAPISKTSGSFTLDAGSSAREGGAAGEVTLGNGGFAVHMSGSGRRAGDYRSADGEVPNSFNRGGVAEVGAAFTRDNGFFGGSFAYDRSHYALPFVEEGQTNLDPRRKVFNLRGERRGLGGAFESVRGSFGVRRYRHDERDGEEVATSFTNNTTELQLLAKQKQAGRLTGSIGASFLTRRFNTEGEEALSPEVDQRGIAGYLYEELGLAPHLTFQFGGRVEHAAFEPVENEPARDFNNFSGSLGLLLRPTDDVSVAVSVARASRNPALEELYFRGAHPGNFAFENGDASLESEHALGVDLSLRWRHSRASGEVTYFLNRVNDFIYREFTGAIEDELPETVFTQADARLQGIESHVDITLHELWAFEGGVDYVRGDFTVGGTPLPRMPPLRSRAGLRFQKNAFQAGVDGSFTAKQDRIFAVAGVNEPVGETPTDGYNLAKIYASYSFASSDVLHTITVRLDNLTNERYSNHLNYLKDLAPEAGRNFKIVYAVKF